MDKIIISIAVLAAAEAGFGQQPPNTGVVGIGGAVLGQQSRFVAVPKTLRHPDAFALLPTPVADDEAVHFAISLQPRDLAGLQACADQVSDPTSSNYRHFLTPEEVGAQFGPSTADVNAAEAFLTSQGLHIDDVAKNNFVITASGTAKQVSAAFKTTLGYLPRALTTGQTGSFRTNLSALQMPANLASKIISIDGIDTSMEHKAWSTTSQLSPPLFRGCYNVAPFYKSSFYGKGVNIGISNWDGYRLNNIPALVSTYGLPVPPNGAGSNIIIVPVGTGTTDGAGTPSGEGDLDMQSVLASAPLSTLYIYDDAQSDTAPPVTTLSKEASDNLVDIVSESYGWATADGSTSFASTAIACHNIHLSMTAQGITYFAAAGDSGTLIWTTTGVRFGYPDIDPEVNMVGGTVATVDSTTGVRSVEQPWGLSDGWGGSGGFDPYDTPASGFTFNTPPTYQTKYIPTLITQYPYRLVPDTASSAGGQNGLGNNDGTGWAYQIYFNDGGTPFLTQIDGTSYASPATAGGLGALYSQYFANVNPTASRSNIRMGRIQNLLYAQGANPLVFYDVTTGSSIGTLPGTGTQATPGPGWDFATGWGAINFNGLYGSLTNSNVATTVDGKAVQPAAYGKYVSGILNSASSAYDIQSANVSGLGQVAGSEIDFTTSIPTGDVVGVAKLTIGAKAISGSTIQLYFYNWKTKNWDYEEAYPSFGSTITNSYSLTVANYVGPTPAAEVRVIARSVLPTRLGTNTYILGLTTATVAYSAAPAN